MSDEENDIENGLIFNSPASRGSSAKGKHSALYVALAFAAVLVLLVALNMK